MSNTENEKLKNEKKIKHLEFIQNIITRMNSNSFMIKGWCVTLVSALFALAAKDSNTNFAVITCIVIPALWFLDSWKYYINGICWIIREKHFRKLYDITREKDDVDFSLNIDTLKAKDWFYNGVLNNTLIIFYGIIIITSLFIMLYIIK